MLATIKLCVVLLAVALTCNGIQAKNTTAVPAKIPSNKDVRNFLTNTSLVTRQINCVLGRGQCDRLGVQLKKAIPEVVNHNCARCTTVQAANAKKLINFIQHNYPVAYNQILNKYRTIKVTPAVRPKATVTGTRILSPEKNSSRTVPSKTDVPSTTVTTKLIPKNT